MVRTIVHNGETVEYVTAKEAAAMAGITVWTLYRWMKDGKGPPARRIGKYIFLPKREFLKWASQEVIP